MFSLFLKFFCHCNVLCDSGSFNINYYDLGLVEEHSHEQESKTLTRDNNLSWFSQLLAYVHEQRQPKISNINDMD